MKRLQFLLVLFACSYLVTSASAQANAYINILTLNSGQVALGSTVDIQVEVGNNGTANITASKVKTAITVPTSLVSILPNAQQTGLPAGWTILSNTAGGVITLCNGTDVIAPSTSRIFLIKVQGNTLGGPSTIVGQLSFSGGINCASPGSLTGDNPADNSSTSSIQVVAGCSLAVNATAGTIACNGGTTSLTALATGLSGSIEYSITGGAPFQSSNVFTVAAGTYTVTARSVTNPITCVATTTLIITEPTAVLAPTISIMQPTCSMATGIVTITSPTIGLTFSVDGGVYNTYPTGGFILNTGAHTIQAKNANNCLSPITNLTINLQPSTPTAPTVGTITQPNCLVSTGTVVLSGLPLGDWTINPGAITGNTTSTTITALPSGNYTFTVTNAVGCTSIPSANVVMNNVLGSPAAPTIAIMQPTCTLATGTITITSTVAGLTFSLDGGAFIAYPAGGFTGIASGNHSVIAKNSSDCLSPNTNIVINPQPTAPAAPTVTVTQPTCTVATGTIIVTSPTTGITFSLDGGAFVTYPAGGFVTTAGTHTLAAQNSNGCTPSITNNIIVTVQPTSPTGVASATAITCFGSTTTLSVVAANGTSPYQYSLNSGAFQTVNTFTVAAGTYTVNIKDANGCTGNTNNLIITQPAAITASITANAIACNGGNALLTVLATGGVGTLEYSLNSGNFQTSNTFTVPAGTYTARVRSVNNPSCLTTTTSTVLIQPTLLKAVATALAINQCGGTTNVKVEGTGGKLPYTGIGNFAKGAGNWSFSITDANGCTATTDINILPPGCVEVRFFPNPAQNNITINHSAAEPGASIQIFELNGALVLSKSIAPNSFFTRLDVRRLASGTYTLVYINGTQRQEKKFIKTNN
jgi:Secretion system C-terminal sorting domain